MYTARCVDVTFGCGWEARAEKKSDVAAELGRHLADRHRLPNNCETVSSYLDDVIVNVRETDVDDSAPPVGNLMARVRDALQNLHAPRKRRQGRP